MSTGSYKLLGHVGSTCSRTVIATLEEVGAKYEVETIDLSKGEHKSPAYLENNQPFGQIPVLFDGEYRLFESRAIIRYIATKHWADSIYPSDPFKRGLVEQWLSVNVRFSCFSQANQPPFC